MDLFIVGLLASTNHSGGGRVQLAASSLDSSESLFL